MNIKDISSDTFGSRIEQLFPRMPSFSTVARIHIFKKHILYSSPFRVVYLPIRDEVQSRPISSKLTLFLDLSVSQPNSYENNYGCQKNI